MTSRTWTTYQLWYGRDEPPSERRELCAGPVRVVLDGRDLRWLRFGGLQIVDRVYVAIRDRNWGTVPGDLSNLVIKDGGDQFTVTFDVAHRQGDLDISWRCEIFGSPDGVITYAMDAVANADATYKLVGLNSHHGMREYAGHPYRGESPHGAIAGVFPHLIGPQLVEDETEVPIFPDVSSLTAQLSGEVAVRFDFAGDTFEWEDQRNWTDASFKAQSFPPRRNGFCHAAKGEHVRQTMTITPIGTPPPERAQADSIRVTVGDSLGKSLPPIGLGMASHGESLSSREAELLRALRPSHLRVDLRLTSPGWDEELVQAIESCRALGSDLELALHLNDDTTTELAALGTRLKQATTTVARVLVFHEHEAATSPQWLTLARIHLHDAVPCALIVGGTNANFCELNRFRPERAPDEGVVYSINPQIHAFDEASLVENLAAQAETVRTARTFSGDRSIVVSPVTLKPRFNAVATEAEAESSPDELPASVDPRQMSLFAAGWTLGSVKYLAESGIAAVTYYETTGWRGVIETDAGSPVPERFQSEPGVVFPLYHVFADLAEWCDGEIVSLHSDDPFAVVGLAVRVNDVTHLLLANVTSAEQRITLSPPRTDWVTIRRLNAETAPVAMREPERFRSTTEHVDLSGDELVLALAPFEILRLDCGG